jgi:hypothetical protein
VVGLRFASLRIGGLSTRGDWLRSIELYTPSTNTCTLISSQRLQNPYADEVRSKIHVQLINDTLLVIFASDNYVIHPHLDPYAASTKTGAGLGATYRWYVGHQSVTSPLSTAQAAKSAPGYMLDISPYRTIPELLGTPTTSPFSFKFTPTPGANPFDTSTITNNNGATMASTATSIFGGVEALQWWPLPLIVDEHSDKILKVYSTQTAVIPSHCIP